MDLKESLFKVLQEKSFFRGKVFLSSGKESDYYLDCKTTTLDPFGSYLVASLICEEVKKLRAHGAIVDAIGGMMIGADPIVGAVAALSYQQGSPIQAFIVRKDPKAHGRMRLIEGDLPEGSRVIILDDVITTGGATLKAIRAVEDQRCSVIKVLCLVDREEGAMEAFQGYDYEPLFRASDFLREVSSF